jgi:hypothetical protein
MAAPNRTAGFGLPCALTLKELTKIGYRQHIGDVAWLRRRNNSDATFAAVYREKATCP